MTISRICSIGKAYACSASWKPTNCDVFLFSVGVIPAMRCPSRR
ncbi:MAG: hypothetical protein ACYTJ0_07755 [Planctomycetota bacterium]|jgi:hypothetical protein